jgi:hypothetical protein
MSPSALAAGLLLAMGQLPWEVGLRSEGRGSTDGEVDLQLDPHATLGYERPDVLVQLNYHPQLVLREPRSRGAFDHVEAGSLEGALALGHTTRLHALQSFSVGSTSLSWLASSPGSAPSSIVRDARSSSVEMIHERSALTIDQAIARRVYVSGTAGYAIDGGLGNGLATIPRTRTADLHAAGSWIGKSDSFSLSGGGNRGWVSTSETSWLFEGTAGWRHAFTPASQRALGGDQPLRTGERAEPRYETELSGGLARFGGSAGGERRFVPTAMAALRRDEPSPRVGAFGARASFRYAPTLDLSTGLLKPRYEMSLTAELRLHRQLVAFGGGGAAYTREPDPPLPEVISQGVLGLTYQPSPRLSISAAARVARLANVEWGVVLTTTFTQIGRF